MYEIFERLLKEYNLKAADVCRGTGLPSSLFSEWKRGKSKPKAEKMMLIARFLNVSVEYLMTGEGEPTPAVEDGLLVRINRLSPENRKKLENRLDELLRIQAMEDQLASLPTLPDTK